jgi:hypothetical protein
MGTDSPSLYKAISAAELEAARTVRFDKSFHEYPFRGPAEAWRIRRVLPVDFEAYGALVLPWRAYLETSTGSWNRVRDEPFDSISEAYTYLGRPVPSPLTLDIWKSDFRMIEYTRTVPPLARSALGQFSRDADAIFIRCHGVERHDWAIDRELFLALPDPFVEMPQPFGDFAIFPRGVPWFIHHRDDESILYLAGSAALIARLESACPEQFVRLTLDDYYY